MIRRQGGGLATTGPPPAVSWAAATLADHDMPHGEIHAVLFADDPELVRRYLALHLERLEERLSDQRRTLAAVERILGSAAERRARTGEDP